MLVTLKPHSAFHDLFGFSSEQVDLVQYSDIISYLNGVHPKVVGYAKQQVLNGCHEGFVLLDKNLKELTLDDLFIRKAKEGDVIHVVPAIFGSGGKNGILQILIGVALVVATGGAGALGVAGSIGGIGAGTALGAAMGGSLSTLIGRIGVSLILAGFSKVFAKKPKEADEATRNNMFGSLSNSTSSDTPVAMHYGQVRVAGQFISGYISSLEHGKEDVIEVGEFFE